MPKLDEWWCLKNNTYIYSNISRHMVDGGREQDLTNLFSDVRLTLRRIEVGGWLFVQTDFDLL